MISLNDPDSDDGFRTTETWGSGSIRYDRSLVNPNEPDVVYSNTGVLAGFPFVPTQAVATLSTALMN
ncbi:hypothetical protein Nmn1133_13860 [Halosegnis longus]|uniref:Uncharacterized protein n=1 Tax=Halosegnis longus TaxID=2216012 RepID=A0AAJ4R602_9EURY|nr:hypothetical protein Nmn1133_13860 [Salella cibi]